MTLDETISTILESAREAGLASAVTAKLVADLKKAAAENKADRGSAPKAKTQFAILVSDPENKLRGLNLVGYVVAMEENAPPQAAHTRIVEAVNNFNNSKRGRKAPLETLADAIAVLKGKWLKREHGEKIAIKTREPVAVQAVSNTLS